MKEIKLPCYDITIHLEWKEIRLWHHHQRVERASMTLPLTNSTPLLMASNR